LDLPIGIHSPEAAAVKAKVYFGLDPLNLGTLATVSCPAACTATLPSLTRGAAYYYRVEWLTAGDVVLPRASTLQLRRVQ
jgi:hypothetical protein